VNQNRVVVRFQRALARALVAPDPAAATLRVARDRRHPPKLRRALREANRAGIEMAALLVARLRFERLLRGCPEAEAWFDADPAGFAAAFRRYHQQVPPDAFFPAAEARAFLAFTAKLEPRRAHERPHPEVA
jgi:hypothetical protein